MIETFTDFWSSVSNTALTIVSSTGLCLDNIPALDVMPIGGRLSQCVSNWKIVCSNTWVLDVISNGYCIPLETIPSQDSIPSNPVAIGEAHEILVKEALTLKEKSAISVVEHCDGEYISTYFAVPKPNRPGQYRPILNLKYFNENVKKYKFSMESVRSIREWLQPNSYCIGLDLQDAFLHIPFHDSSKKYLRFKWLGELLEWQVIVFGLTCSPRVLTKVIKPIIAFLRLTFAILVSIYLDDMLLQSKSPELCILHMEVLCLVFMALGWSFKWSKCSLVPSQEFHHLGFDWNTRTMTISCPQKKVVKLQNLCSEAYSSTSLTVLELERIIGTMESVKPAVPLTNLYLRSLQKQLITSKHHDRNPNEIIFLSQTSMDELRWWINPMGFAANCSAPIREPVNPTLEIWSDANQSMGGSHSSRGAFKQRSWTKVELSRKPHINLLELRAAREGLTLAQEGDIVRLHLDSQVAAAYIRCQGGTKSSVLSREAVLLWREALARKVTLLTPHWLSTKDNSMADFLSHNKMTQWECMLLRSVFRHVLETLEVFPTLDVFASRDTHQLPRYMSWYPDSHAVARDAMIHPWDPVSYLFPPSPMIMKCLQKIRAEKIRAIMIIPQWPSSLWWPVVQEMLVEPPLPLPHFKEVLIMMKGGQPPYLNPLVAVHLFPKN